MTATYVKPEQRLVPRPTPETEAFWTQGRDGVLMIYKCASCGHFFHPPAPTCWRCQSTDVSPQPTSGRGTVGSYTINRQQWLPNMPPPYVIAVVELDDEPDTRVMSNIIGVDPDEPGALRIGMPVEVVFEEWDGVFVPLFRPTTEAAQ